MLEHLSAAQAILGFSLLFFSYVIFDIATSKEMEDIED
jgi:hypothetical protein